MKTFMKLKLKKEKISDVQKALRSGSGEIEFKDFRETLKEWVTTYSREGHVLALVLKLTLTAPMIS